MVGNRDATGFLWMLQLDMRTGGCVDEVASLLKHADDLFRLDVAKYSSHALSLVSEGSHVDMELNLEIFSIGRNLWSFFLCGYRRKHRGVLSNLRKELLSLLSKIVLAVRGVCLSIGSPVKVLVRA